MESICYFRVVIILISFCLNCNTKADSYCRPISHKIKLWDCQGSTATFDEAAHKRVSNILKKVFLSYSRFSISKIFGGFGK